MAKRSTTNVADGALANAAARIPVASSRNEHLDSNALLAALKTLKKGDFSIRLPLAESVIGAAIAEAFNDLADLLENDTRETARIARVVGKEGRITQRANRGAATGAWADRIESINTLTGDLVQPTEEVARVIGAVAKGDLSQRIPLEHEGTPLKGEFLRIGTTVNTMVDQLGSFASEVTRVAREVGTEGKLGGQAEVKGVAGTWKDLTDSVNSHGRQPHRPGAQHRRRDDGRRQRRPLQEDHRRRQGRDPRAEEHHQHDGRPAPVVRLPR